MCLCGNFRFSYKLESEGIKKSKANWYPEINHSLYYFLQEQIFFYNLQAVITQFIILKLQTIHIYFLFVSINKTYVRKYKQQLFY